MAAISTLRREAADCRACDLWRDATQTVFGEGSADAQIVLVGEQPGDMEDLAGHPFVGPAGHVLDEALAEAGIDRDTLYVTNAVKHFKWKARGKRRIHDKPNWSEITACKPWLDAELDALKPRVVVPLGATAAQALLGRSFRVTQRRGEVIDDSGIAPYVVATIHPSAILRLPDEAARAQGRADLASDLSVASNLIKP
jgi:DNA polymerase